MKIVAPMFIVAVAIYQGSSIMNPYWRVSVVHPLALELTRFYRLVLWQQDRWGLSRGAYVSLPPFSDTARIDVPSW